MNRQLTALQALDKVPGWHAEEAQIEKLQGGLSNRVYHVRSNGHEAVLRLAADAAESFGQDRSHEMQIMESAARAGIAPAVLYSDPDAGILVTEFLHGRVWQGSDLASDKNLQALAELLRRVHDLPLCGIRFDLPLFAEMYQESVRASGRSLEFASYCVGIVRKYAAPEHVTCCHNDIVATNVIDSGRLMLIDWEYACDNDPMFDLASAIAFHDLDRKRQRVLLNAYAGGANRELEERLADQIRIFDAIQWLWLAARQVRSPQPKQAKRLEELQMRIG